MEIDQILTMIEISRREMKKIVALVVAMLVILGCSLVAPANSPTAVPPAVILPTAIVPTAILPTPIPPTAAATATLGPQQYFTEEFEGGMANWSIYYMPPDTTISTEAISDVEVSFEPGYLQFKITDTYIGAFAAYDPFEYGDVRIDARVENFGRVSNDFALMCRYSEDGWYEFNIKNDGYYYLNYIEIRQDGRSYVDTIYLDASTLVKQDANEYGLVCNGNTFSMYINGEKVGQINHSTLATGKVGVEGFSLKVTPVTLRVEWVKISQP
jgi:hypothetical protein